MAALGRPEVDRATHELSDGQLPMRIRGWQREQAWGSRYVGHELAGTHQTAAHHRQAAALRRAEAGAATDGADRLRLHQEAVEAAALAQALDQRAAQPQQLDDARAVWLAHTAGTRAAAEDAEALLAERHANDAEPEPVVTAEEWPATHRAAIVDDERTCTITEDDVADDGTAAVNRADPEIARWSRCAGPGCPPTERRSRPRSPPADGRGRERLMSEPTYTRTRPCLNGQTGLNRPART